MKKPILRISREAKDRADRVINSALMMLSVTRLDIFAKHFCVTLNKTTRPSGPAPFPCHEWSKEFFRRFQDGESVLWEKSRQMQATWTVVIALVWALIFRAEHAYLVVSEKEEFVHDKKRTPNSILGKAGYIIDRLPKKWRDEFVVNHMVIYNKRTGSVIQGATANENAGRSGAWDGVFMDEAAHQRHGESILGSMNTACYGPLIMVSTPHPDHDIGEDVFSRLRWEKDHGGMVIMTTPWNIHPERLCNHGPEEPHVNCWYAKACERLTDRQIAAELNIEYGGSKQGRCFYSWDRNLYTGKAAYIPNQDVWRGYDFGVGRTAILIGHVKWIKTQAGNNLPQLTVFDYIESGDRSAYYYRRILGAKAEQYTVRSRMLDIGDPYILDQRHGDLKSWRDHMSRKSERAEYSVTVQPSPCVGVSTQNLISNTCKFMRTVIDEHGNVVPLLIVGDHLDRLITVIERYAFPTDDYGRIISDKPDKNIFSHGADALQYLCWKISPIQDIASYEDDDLELEDYTAFSSGEGSLKELQAF